MSNVLEQYDEISDPLMLGYADVDELALAYETAGGIAFPHVDGTLWLRRRTLYPMPQRWQDGLFCGASREGSSTIKNWPGFGHDASQGYQYAAMRVFGNGYASAATEPVRVDFDDEGNRITPPLPKWPNHLRVVAIADGKIRVTWAYNSFGQGGWPTDFAVYIGPNAGSIYYGVVIATVPFVAGRRLYTYTAGAFSDGAVRGFAVRARNADEIAEHNTVAVEATARADGPDDAIIYMAATRRPRERG